MSQVIHRFQILLAFLLLLLAGCKSGTTDVPTDSKNILVYNDQGVWQESAEAVKRCLEEDGRAVRFITVAELQQTISDAGMIIFPGCNPVEVNDSFGFTGRENLRDFVRRGGGFIGIGGGAYLASDSIRFHNSTPLEEPLAFFHGSAVGPIPQIATSGYTLTYVELNGFLLNPLGLPGLEVLYHGGDYGGPGILIIEPADALTAATLQQSGNLPALVLFQYGWGRVALCVVHPEIEENDDRDGSDFASELQDSESDWFWLQLMVEWTLRERNE